MWSDVLPLNDSKLDETCPPRANIKNLEKLDDETSHSAAFNTELKLYKNPLKNEPGCSDFWANNPRVVRVKVFPLATLFFDQITRQLLSKHGTLERRTTMHKFMHN